MQYKQAYLDALCEFAAKDPQVMADMSGGMYSPKQGIEITYLGRPCHVTYPQGHVRIPGWPELPHEELIIILQYLARASGLPPREQWLSFLELPGGPHHFAPFQQEAIFPLARAFGEEGKEFLATAQKLGGKTVQKGHAGMEIPVFPRLSLTFILWLGDDEFPATANILFNAVSQTYLPTASLYMMGIAVAKRLLALAGK